MTHQKDAAQGCGWGLTVWCVGYACLYVRIGCGLMRGGVHSCGHSFSSGHWVAVLGGFWWACCACMPQQMLLFAVVGRGRNARDLDSFVC